VRQALQVGMVSQHAGAQQQVLAMARHVQQGPEQLGPAHCQGRQR